MKIRAFITHKLCEKYADCQDRFCINEDNRCIALSDGMSQSIFPDYWAEILAEQYAREGHCDDEDRKRLCNRWMQRVIEYRNGQIKMGKDPWKLDNFLASRKGAGATICGVRFENATDWKGDVLGDSCIIKVNTKDWNIDILTSEEKAFDSFPDFYDSYPEKIGRGAIQPFEGSIGPDDIVLLVSDPFSEYFYKNKEQVEELVRQILSLTNHDDFCKLVDDWRTKGMHNDDSTLCVVEFDNRLDFDILHQDIIAELINNEDIISEKEVVEETPISIVSTEEDNKEVVFQTNDDKKESYSENNDEKSTVGADVVQEVNDRIREVHKWILCKIDDLLKCSSTTPGYKGFLKGKRAVNKTISANKVEKFKEEIVEYLNQLIK